MIQIDEVLARLPRQHQEALQWFFDHAGSEQPWTPSLPDGTLLVTKAKGIYKPADSDYALSVRQVLKGPYPDLDPIHRADGTWTYQYFQEGAKPIARDDYFTNRGLMACQRDRVPVGVLRQTKGKPGVRYSILGLALVTRWEEGYFFLEGFSKDGISHSG